MLVVKGYRGTRYNFQLIEDPNDVMAPPYDVISPQQRDSLYERSPHNVVRLILGKEMPGDDEYNNKYTRASSFLKSWKRDGIFVDDMHASLYFYEQTFIGPDDKEYSRRGFFGQVKLESYQDRKIFAHEHTRSSPKADRLKLIRNTHSNLSPVFCLYPDSKKETDKIFEQVMSQRPWQKFIDPNGVSHRIWVVGKKEIIEKVSAIMKEKQLIIADGHHRYETALNYQREMREVTGKTDGEQPFDYIMMFLTSLESDGLLILPTHRILHKELGRDVHIPEIIDELKEVFSVKEEKVNLAEPETAAQEIKDKLAKLGSKRVAFAMLLPGNRIIYLQLKARVKLDDLIDDDTSRDLKSLDVSILHKYIISQIWIGNPEVDVEEDDLIFTHDMQEVFNHLKNRKACAAFILNAPDMEKIKKLVLNGELMPPKTTYFHPKIISGLVIRDMSV